MSQQMPYITLDSCITDYLNESEQSQNKYFKCWHIAFRGMEDLGLDFFYRIRSVKLPINDNMTVTLPADYLNYSKIGVLNDRGEIIPLKKNDKLTTYADLLPDRVEKTQDNTLIDWSQWNSGSLWLNYWNGYSYGNVYGVPSGAPFVGSFKVDAANGVILLDENFQYHYLMLEYVASPQAGQDYYVPMQFREALISWLWWKDKKAVSINRGQVGIGRSLKSDYYNDRRLAIAKWKPLRQQEIYQASQEMSRLAVKS